MPIYEVEAPNGQILEIEGDTPPSEQDLDNIFKNTNTQNLEQQQEPIKAGVSIDVTPSGLFKGSQNVVASALTAPIVAKRDNISVKDAFNQNMDKVREWRKENPTPLQDFAVDTAGYQGLMLIPGLEPLAAAKNASTAARLGNFALNSAKLGAIPGALEGLKNGIGEAGLGALGGTALAAGVQGLINSVPYVGRVGNKVLYNSFPGLKEKTVKQLTKPGSQALELTDDTAQNLLMNTTEKIQKNYNELLNNAGAKVSDIAKNIPAEKGVYDTALKNSLDDIYAQYSTSGQKELNSAFNNAGDVYDDITYLINKAADPLNNGKISASKLNDIMKNIKNYNIDWNKTSSQDKKKILKQIYGEYSRKLNNLSPELRKANKTYSKLASFDDNEGVRQIIEPDVIKNENIDTASRALRNYNATITSGNKNKNIQDLEKILVDNGYEPFLNKIDDVNAANELLKTAVNGFNPLGITDKIKLMETPLLKGLRAYNSSNLPVLLQNIGNVAGDVSRRVLPATLIAPWQ